MTWFKNCTLSTVSETRSQCDFSLRLNLKTLVSAKDEVTDCMCRRFSTEYSTQFSELRQQSLGHVRRHFAYEMTLNCGQTMCVDLSPLSEMRECLCQLPSLTCMPVNWPHRLSAKRRFLCQLVAYTEGDTTTPHDTGMHDV